MRMIDIKQVKKTLRKEVLERRDSIPLEVILQKSEKIYKNLLSVKEFINGKNIAFFVGYSKEVQTKEMIINELKRGKSITIPRVESSESMSFVEITSLEKLISGYKGILEPSKEAPVCETEPDVIILPGTVFDRMGGRMGYGRGYYDRYLARLKTRPTRIALCFSEQIVDRVPMDENDLSMEIIITDKEVIKVKN